MRAFGPLKDGDSFRIPAEHVGVAIVTTAGFAIAADYPTDAHTMRVSAPMRAYFNPATTGASVPSTALLGGTTASSGQTIGICANRPESFYIPSDSTGFAVAGETSGVITVEFWKQG